LETLKFGIHNKQVTFTVGFLIAERVKKTFPNLLSLQTGNRIIFIVVVQTEMFQILSNGQLWFSILEKLSFVILVVLLLGFQGHFKISGSNRI
jgi:hypothetical protein